MKRLERWLHSVRIAKRFGPELRPHRWRLVGVGVVSLLVATFDLLRPWPIQWIFDGALVPSDDTGFRFAGIDASGLVSELSFTTIVWIGVAAAVTIALARSLLQYVQQLELAQMGHQVTRGLRFRVFSHLAHLSPFFHAKHKSGDLLVRLMGDAPMVSTMLVDSSVELATRTLLVVGTLVVMSVMDPLLTLSVFVALPIVVLVVRWISGHIHIAVRKQRRKEGDLADYLHEAIAATETIQSLGGSEHVVRRFARNNRQTARAGLKAKRLSARLSASVETLLAFALAGALALGSFRVAGGHLSPGELLVFLSYVRSLLKPLRSASKHAERIAKGTACGDRILAILDEEDRVESRPGSPQAPASPRELSFDDIRFAYEKGTPALHDFNASFRRGELAALVGRSGAGKSTAASLALRLFDPDAGQVSLDGAPLDSFDLQSMRACVGVSLQRTALFGDSVRENLLLGRPDASDEEIWSALEKAGAGGFVRELPEGLDAKLGAGGAGLSGGERSRLSLARTLLRKAPVLIVDEPFAGLDRAAARLVAQSLRALAHDGIVIVIAHDLESLELYDRIIFMDEGRVVSQGTHAELLDELPLYREVVRTTAEVAT